MGTYSFNARRFRRIIRTIIYKRKNCKFITHSPEQSNSSDATFGLEKKRNKGPSANYGVSLKSPRDLLQSKNNSVVQEHITCRCITAIIIIIISFKIGACSRIFFLLCGLHLLNTRFITEKNDKITIVHIWSKSFRQFTIQTVVCVLSLSLFQG